MEFTHSATFPFPFDTVLTTSASADFVSQLEIVDVATPELTLSNDDGNVVESVIAYAYTGTIDPMAKMLLKNKPLTWVQTISIDRFTKSGPMNVVYMEGSLPHECSATVTYTDDGKSCTRTINGKIFVKMMGVGSMVENKLVQGMNARFESEAQSLIAFLQK